MRLRVVVYNVKAFRRGVRRVAGVLAEHAPDIALIQECGPRHRLRRFARALGMEPVSHHFFLRRSIHEAVLVRPPWRVLAHRLHRFPKDVRLYPRGALLVRIGRSGHRVWAASVHLGLKPGVRKRNADELSSVLLGLNGPVLAGGDLNEGPDGQAASWMSARLWDAFARAGEGPGETYPAEDPTARIDYLFAGEGVEFDRAVVLSGPAAAAGSDHLPLLVDLEVGGPPRAETIG
ncbi:MAG: endonuclease/exonuclease/phosphatase family protein [Actinomycetota bacterium]